MDAAPDDNLPRLLGLWQQIAERYQNRSGAVYFELFNEPHDKFIDARWNARFRYFWPRCANRIPHDL